MRKPLEGVGNIVRFNWHFYLAAVGAILLFWGVGGYGPDFVRWYAWALAVAIGVTTAISLLVSFYVYDVSNLYALTWLPQEVATAGSAIINIHAGFDETSALLRHRFVDIEVLVFDFYDPLTHTEASIRRARAAYPPFPGTQRVKTQQLPASTSSVGCVFLILAAHEIRQHQERLALLQEVRRVLQPGGKVVVVEHLRDAANFVAYTIGFWHFYSRKTWLKAFDSAGFVLNQEQKITPFISAFILSSNGNPS